MKKLVKENGPILVIAMFMFLFLGITIYRGENYLSYVEEYQAECVKSGGVYNQPYRQDPECINPDYFIPINLDKGT